jgi:REP element-mobilizing transposase RayT
VIFDETVDDVLRQVCLEIWKRYELFFLEIGVERDHVHFLVQSVPSYSVSKIIRVIKSITAREIFKRAPHVRRQLWGGEFWSKGYTAARGGFVNSVGRHQNEEAMQRYVRAQGLEKEYKRLHRQQLNLFDNLEG